MRLFANFIFVGIFLLSLVAQAAPNAGASECSAQYHLAFQGKTYVPSELSAYLDHLDAEIKREVAAQSAEKPASLSRQYSYFQQMRNAELLWKGQDEFLQEIERLKELTYNHSNSVTMGQTTDEFMNRIFKRTGLSLDLGPMAAARGKVTDEMKFHIHDNAIAKLQVRPLEKNALEFRARVEGYRKKYGADLISEDAELNAAYNFTATDTFLNLRGKKLANPKALDAITLLAPLTDDALDRGLDVKSAMIKITKKLHGEVVKAETPYERIVFDFIDVLMREFPPEKDPTLVEMLKELQKVQLQSVKLQKNPNISPEDLLQVTNRKGGLAVLSFMKVGFKDLTKEETEYFYRLGTHAQKLDDLIDFSDDLQSGTTTLWTKAFRQDKKLDQPVQLLLQSQKMLDASAEKLLADAPGGKDMASFVEFGTKGYIGGALLQPKLAKQLSGDFGASFPLRPAHMQKMMDAAFAKVADSDPDKHAVMQILQRNLLKGAGPSGRTAESELSGISGIPGYWQMMQANYYYQLANVKIARSQHGFVLAVIARLGALSYIVNHIESPAARGAIGAAVVAMLAKKNGEHFDKLLLAAAAWMAYEKWEKNAAAAEHERKMKELRERVRLPESKTNR